MRIMYIGCIYVNNYRLVLYRRDIRSNIYSNIYSYLQLFTVILTDLQFGMDNFILL